VEIPCCVGEILILCEHIGRLDFAWPRHVHNSKTSGLEVGHRLDLSKLALPCAADGKVFASVFFSPPSDASLQPRDIPEPEHFRTNRETLNGHTHARARALSLSLSLSHTHTHTTQHNTTQHNTHTHTHTNTDTSTPTRLSMSRHLTLTLPPMQQSSSLAKGT